MPVLVWKHGESQSAVVARLQSMLEQSGYGAHVTWADGAFSASAGPLSALLKARGEITDCEIIVHECGGLLGPAALARLRSGLARLYPGGDATT